MVALPRKTQKIFGSTAGSNQIGVIGSFAAMAPAYSTDPDTIQSLSNYLQGWYGVVVGQNSPAIQDMNALDFLITRQLAYIFERGIPQWDAGTTYYTGCLVLGSDNTIYQSLQDNNTNNALTSTSFWSAFLQNGVRTKNAPADSYAVATGETLAWPNLTIATGKTMTVASGAYLMGQNYLAVSGTLIVTGTAIIS